MSKKIESSPVTPASNSQTTTLGTEDKPVANPKAPANKKWVTPPDKPHIFNASGAPKPKDVGPAKTSFLADLKTLAKNHPELLKDHIKEVDNPNDPKHPNYQVTLYDGHGKPENIIVDGKVLGTPGDATPGSGKPAWATLYEKAYYAAQEHNAQQGTSAIPWRMLIGNRWPSATSHSGSSGSHSTHEQESTQPPASTYEQGSTRPQGSTSAAPASAPAETSQPSSVHGHYALPKGSLANQAWGDAASQTSDSGKLVMTDTRSNQFGGDYSNVKDYNDELVKQGKFPVAYMNTGMMDSQSNIGKDPAWTQLRSDLEDAGVLGEKDRSWDENVLDVAALKDPSTFEAVKDAYTKFASTMKDLGYRGISVDNLDFYNLGPNHDLPESTTNAMGTKFAQMVADVIHGQGLAAIAKNAPALVDASAGAYVREFDGIITESALNYSGDIKDYQAFADAGKPVWNFQYTHGSNSNPSWMETYDPKSGWVQR